MLDFSGYVVNALDFLFKEQIKIEFENHLPSFDSVNEFFYVINGLSMRKIVNLVFEYIELINLGKDLYRKVMRVDF